MRRFRVAGLGNEGAAITLPDDACDHVRVLRLSLGDAVELFDGRGKVALATLSQLGETCVARIDRIDEEPPGARDIVLVQCLPKGDKLEAIVRMASELGVAAIELVQSEHCVTRWDGARVDAKLERLSRIVSEACRQCERATVPEVRYAGGLLEHARKHADACWVVPTPRTGVSLHAALSERLAQASVIRVVVGPEGGLSRLEEQFLAQCGAICGEIAAHVLRVETAAPVALALVHEATRAAAHKAR